MSAPAFQCYAKDLYTGTSDLSAAEFGTYWRGICWSWDNGPLPLDDERRRRVLLLDREEFAAIWPVISSLWTKTDTGWTQARLEETRASLEEFREAKSKAGQASANKRATERQQTAQQNGNTTSTEGATDGQQEGQRNSTLHSALCSLPSALSDLPSADCGDAPRALAPTKRHVGLIDGADQRRHGQHAWCDYERGMCVPYSLHDKLIKRLQKTGPELQAWYPTVIAAYAGRTMVGDVFKFWESEADAWVGATVTRTTPKGKGEESFDAMRQTLQRRANRAQS